MNNKENFDMLVKSGIKLDPCKRVRSLVTLLIDALYKPSLYRDMVLDHDRLAEYNLNKTEPVNWGSLNVFEVEEFGGDFLVSIGEALPNECPELCAYIEKYMSTWGWSVRVKTEW